MRQFVSVLSDQNMEPKRSKNCAQLLRLKCICHISIPDSWIGCGDTCRCIISVLVKKFCKWWANTRNLRVSNMSPLCLHELRGGYYCKTRCCWMILPSICPTLHHNTQSAQTPPLFSQNPVAAARCPRRFIDLRRWTLQSCCVIIRRKSVTPAQDAAANPDRLFAEPSRYGERKTERIKWTDLNLLTGCMHSFTWQSMQRLSHATLLWDTHTQTRLPGATSVAAISTSPLKQAQKKGGGGDTNEMLKIILRFALLCLISLQLLLKNIVFFPHQRQQ